MNTISNQKGASIIAVIAIMLILAVMGAALVSLVTTGSDVSVNQLQSEQALNVAEGGKEYILANRTFPNYSTQGATINLGVIGSNVSNFKVDTPTYLTVAVAIGNTTITVNDTSGFASPSGRIVIDSEVLAYTAKTATTFTVTAATAAHTVNNAVYPVTTVSSLAIASDTTINVASTTGFVIPGVIKIGSEYIYCTSTPTTTSFSNCTRGYKGSTAASHLGSNVFQYSITSTGTVGTANNSNRVVRAAVYGSTSVSGSVGVNIKQGNFIKSITPACPAPCSQTIAGVGFQPKAVIFFWTSRQTAVGFNGRDNMGIGFATSSTNERAVSIAEDDNANTSNAGRRKSDTNMIVTLDDGDPTLGAQAELTSFNADGFTINWTTNNNRALYIYYIAIGGTDITNALAGAFPSNTGVGNQLVTGLGFQPDFVMFLSGFTGANDTDLSDSQLSLGYAESSAAMGAIVTGSTDNRNGNDRKRSQQRTSACILLLRSNVTQQDAIADFVSMDADGFRINWSNAPAAATPIFYLALKGGRYNVGSFDQATVLGNQSVTGVGFQPSGLMMAIFNKIAQAGIIADNEMSIGAAQSSTARGSIWGEAQNGVDPSQANNYTNNAVAMTMATGPATINAQTDFVSFDSNGFTLNWTTVDATARQILYWVAGPTAQPTIPIATTHEEVY